MCIHTGSYQLKKTTRIGILAAVLIIFLGAILVHPSSAQEEGPVYVVQPGDTLYSIALQFGTTIELISTVNNIGDPSSIAPGLRLIIPGFEGVSGVLDLRTVEFGESLASLSSRYGIPAEAVIQLNRILNPDRIYIGQSVILSIPDAEVQQERRVAIGSGQTALSFSATNMLNPWELHDLSGPLDRLWVLPGDILALPRVDLEPTSYLPFPIDWVEVSPNRVLQGRTLEVRVRAEQTVEIGGRVGERALHFESLDPSEQVALQGIHALLDPGMYDLELNFAWEGLTEGFSFVQPLRVASGDYYFDPVLYVPPETIDPQLTQPEDELISELVNTFTAEKIWEGAFEFPSTSTSVFPSVFGSRRNYNDTGYSYYHSGLDFYGGTGTPILAPAPGRVVFAGPLEVRGKVTFIDHGWGVFSGYLHQSELLVSVGDSVESGDVIGLVGATGRVTGPHLHWEVWVGGVPVDPLEWTSQEFPGLIESD